MELRNNDKLLNDFTAVEKDCLRLYAAKTHDYGNSFDEAMNKLGLSYAVGRLYDKINRLVNLCGKEDSAQVKDESLDDTLMDLANYAIMTLSYRRNAKNTQNCKGNSEDARCNRRKYIAVKSMVRDIIEYL